MEFERWSKLNSTVSETELKEWYQVFAKGCLAARGLSNPIPVIDQAAMRGYFQQYFPLGDSQFISDQVWKIMDLDQDQQINFKDFILFMLEIKYKPIHTLFKFYDLNQDGIITKDEMIQLITALDQAMGGHRLDLITKRVNQVFEIMDLDQNEQVNLNEFILAIQKDPEHGIGMNLLQGMI
jgi:Ca2+-binding EF-hand superfamily protein